MLYFLVVAKSLWILITLRVRTSYSALVLLSLRINSFFKSVRISVWFLLHLEWQQWKHGRGKANSCGGVLSLLLQYYLSHCEPYSLR